MELHEMRDSLCREPFFLNFVRGLVVDRDIEGSLEKLTPSSPFGAGPPGGRMLWSEPFSKRPPLE